MPDTPVHPGPDDPTTEFEQVRFDPAPESADDVPQDENTASIDSGKSIRTWVWMIVVSGFGLFLVFGSVRAHYWEENARGTYYVPVTKGMQILDIWRAQVNGLPEVAHQSVLKGVFLISVFGFIGLSVIALWLATVEIRNGPTVNDRASSSDETSSGSASDAASAQGASAG